MASKALAALFIFGTALLLALTTKAAEQTLEGCGNIGSEYDCQYRICPAIYNPVCGTDGQTYENECQLCWEQRCNNPALQVWYPGQCWATKEVKEERRRRRSLRQVKLPQSVVQELQDLSRAVLTK